MRFFLANRFWFLGIQWSTRTHCSHSHTGPVLALIEGAIMKKKLISWDAFQDAVSAQAPWLLSAWIAFTGDGVILLTKDEKPEEPILKEPAKG